MPTVIATFALTGLLRFAHVEMPRWHLAFFFALLVGVALFPNLGWASWALNVGGSFLASWAFFIVLDQTDNIERRAMHYLILFFGMVALIGTRLWLDLVHYQIMF